jgi:SanA protein
MKKLVRWAVIAGLLLLSYIVACNLWVVQTTSHMIYSHPDSLPEYPVGLVLGTSHRLSSGDPNPNFEQRIETAVSLYRANKVRHFIVSGDNRTRYYNEPLEMKRALVARGIPAQSITLDYAGLRTLDSIVRSKKIFGQQQLIIVTQAFHTYRALFICRHNGIEAVALATPQPVSWRTLFREYLARAWVVIDLFVLDTQPRFLGKEEPLRLSDPTMP